MSIATMKAKSLTLYGKSHSTKDGFSLNGTLRLPSQGQNLGRSVTRTPFRGPAPMAHGGGGTCKLKGWRARICGNKFPVDIQRSSIGIPQSLIKRSTMNQSGMLEKRFAGLFHGGNANIYRVDKEASGHAQLVGKRALECGIGVKKEVGVYNEEFHRSNYSKYSTCRPYTKTILNMDYSKYHKNLISACNLEGVYKGINGC